MTSWDDSFPKNGAVAVAHDDWHQVDGHFIK
jgi:hypothetical protein